MAEPAPIRDQLRTLLTRARMDRDRSVSGALRSALAALENAEAVAPGAAATPGSAHVAGAVDFGAREAERRTLTEAEEHAIVAAEVADLRGAADQYDQVGEHDEASAARRAADVLAGVAG